MVHFLGFPADRKNVALCCSISTLFLRSIKNVVLCSSISESFLDSAKQRSPRVGTRIIFFAVRVDHVLIRYNWVPAKLGRQVSILARDGRGPYIYCSSGRFDRDRTCGFLRRGRWLHAASQLLTARSFGEQLRGAPCRTTRARHLGSHRWLPARACRRRVAVLAFFAFWTFSPAASLEGDGRGVATPDVFFPNSTCLACGHPFPIR